MGVSIHYRGRIKYTRLVGRLCVEIEDIAGAMGWETVRFDDDWSAAPDARMGSGNVINGNLGLKGIQLMPEGAEPLSLFFDHEGYVRSPIGMLMVLEGAFKPAEAWVSLKTQFAGADRHVWLIGLLKYLKKVYMPGLEVSDESGYWEHGDRAQIEKSMELINGKLGELESAIDSGQLGDFSGLDAGQIASRIEHFLNRESGNDVS